MVSAIASSSARMRSAIGGRAITGGARRGGKLGVGRALAALERERVAQLFRGVAARRGHARSLGGGRAQRVVQCRRTGLELLQAAADGGLVALGLREVARDVVLELLVVQR